MHARKYALAFLCLLSCDGFRSLGRERSADDFLFGLRFHMTESQVASRLKERGLRLFDFDQYKKHGGTFYQDDLEAYSEVASKGSNGDFSRIFEPSSRFGARVLGECWFHDYTLCAIGLHFYGESDPHVLVSPLIRALLDHYQFAQPQVGRLPHSYSLRFDSRPAKAELSVAEKQAEINVQGSISLFLTSPSLQWTWW
jgi:hypothetical protein